MSVWVRLGYMNFDWTVKHCQALINEFEFRFGKKHKCQEYLDLIKQNPPDTLSPTENITNPPRCFGKFKELINITDDITVDYKNYYNISKKWAKWTNRPVPEWFNPKN